MENNKFRENYLVCNPQESEFKGNNIDLNNLPLVSFCIPTKNNEDTLDNCLRSIKQQNYPKIEIIIIDGYSDDHTVDIAEKYADKIIFDKGTYGSACQSGFELAKGDIIALIDSDIIIPHENWLLNAIQFFNFSDNVSSVWPLYQAPPNASKFSRLYQTNLYPLIIFNRIKNNRGYFGGGNTLFLKKVLVEIGGIDRSIHWGADFDWAKRMKNKGYIVVYITDPLYHDTMRTFKQFYYKQFAGAKTFTQTGFQMMGLSKKDIFFEHFIIGFKGMFIGLLVERDLSWLYYPFLLFARLLAYTITTIKNIFQKTEVTENEQ